MREAIVSVVAFYFFIAHIADDAEQPFISIAIFRDRNFVIGLVFMFVVRRDAGGDAWR